MSEENIKLQKVFVEFDDPAGEGLMQYQTELRNGDSLSCVKLPFDENRIPGEVTMKIYHDGGTEPEIAEGLDLVKAIITNAKDMTSDVQDEIRKNRVFNALADGDIPFEMTKNAFFPEMTMTDITERDIFGEAEVSSADLQSSSRGIWAWHGLRKFSLKVKDLENVTEIAEEAGDFEEKKVALYWYKVDNEEIAPCFEEEVRFNKETDEYVAYINTNNLGEVLKTSGISQHPMFSGRFEIHYIYRNYKNVYSFPLRVCVHDTRLNEDFENHLLGDSDVSIDFGTSSTCAAIRKVGTLELFTLSGPYKRDNEENHENPYENPTNLMIFSWDELYRQWQNSNPNCPFVTTKLKSTTEDKYVDYDSGYTVNDVYQKDLMDLQSKRRMEAILSQIKMIPYMLDNGVEIRFTPYNDKNRSVIRVTDKVDDEDESHFNPIAFYGYLLSRAINNPGEKIYRTYKITYPVKFKDYKETLRAALEMGIKRALPRPLQNAVDEDGEPFIKVEMKFEESVACLGAVVGSQIKITPESPEAKLFAVFDLGGGTLDTSYGMFRKSTEDELDDDKQDYTIELFGVGGNDLVGGEKLIHNIAYQIYKSNREIIEQEHIKFVRPLGELKPQGFDDLLLEYGKNDQIADTNVTILKETIARKLFKEEGVIDNHMADIFPGAPNADQCSVTLRNLENADTDVELDVKGIDDFLHDKIEEAIIGFETELGKIFDSEKVQEAMRKAGINDYSRDKIKIFFGGNASRQHYVQELMEEHFPNNERVRIGEGIEHKEDVSDALKLNCKTAVAFGQLKLEAFNIDDTLYSGKTNHAPFAYTVGYKDSGSEMFMPVINPGSNSMEWVRANQVGNDKKTDLYYTSSPTLAEKTLQHLHEKVIKSDAKYLWLRVNPFKSNSIEYRIAGRKDQPSADEPTNEAMTFDLIDKATFN